MCSKEESTDIARIVLVSGLPTEWLTIPKEMYTVSICKWFEKNFGLSDDTIENVYCCPLTDPTNQENGCRCLVSFRSRVHKHRVIAQKSKIETPTTIDDITEIPQEFLRVIEDSAVKSTVEETMDLDNQASSCDPDHIDLGINNASSNVASLDKNCDENNKSTNKESLITDSNKDYESREAGVTVSAVSPQNNTIDNTTDSKEPRNSSSKVNMDHAGNDAPFYATTNLNEEDNAVIQSESKLDEAVKEGRESSVNVSKNLSSSISRFDSHEEHYLNLPINLIGAPCFQWRACRTAAERRLLIICEALVCDLYNPWLYPILMRSRLVETNFPLLFAQDNPKDSVGRIKLYFSDETAMASCVINYLVYIRTTKARQLRIFLPQTKLTLDYKEDLNSRLGRVRSPPVTMRQLLIKSLTEDITEDMIRNIAFKNFNIESVEFRTDLLKNRCALITFPSAELAIIAHSNHNYVHFGDPKDDKGWLKVLYVCTSVRGWDTKDLLTRTEFKAFKLNPSKNQRKMKFESAEENAGLDENRDPDSKEEKNPNNTTNEGTNELNSSSDVKNNNENSEKPDNEHPNLKRSGSPALERTTEIRRKRRRTRRRERDIARREDRMRRRLRTGSYSRPFDPFEKSSSHYMNDANMGLRRWDDMSRFTALEARRREFDRSFAFPARRGGRDFDYYCEPPYHSPPRPLRRRKENRRERRRIARLAAAGSDEIRGDSSRNDEQQNRDRRNNEQEKSEKDAFCTYNPGEGSTQQKQLKKVQERLQPSRMMINDYVGMGGSRGTDINASAFQGNYGFTPNMGKAMPLGALGSGMQAMGNAMQMGMPAPGANMQAMCGFETAEPQFFRTPPRVTQNPYIPIAQQTTTPYTSRYCGQDPLANIYQQPSWR